MEGFTWFEFLKFLLPAIIIVVGWFVSNKLSFERDLKNKRRELVTQYLINAYRNIENTLEDFQRRGREYDPIPLRNALADVVLFGTPEQIEFVVEFENQLKAGEKYGNSLTKLIFNLRDSLRNELQLPKDERTHLPQFILDSKKSNVQK